EDNLNGLLRLSDVIILPITSGGGSNLKTAEAILTSKPIVATNFAFRAYENFLDLPNITISNSKTIFKKSIIDTLKKSQPSLNAQHIRKTQTVQWNYVLAPLKSAIMRLAIGRIGARLETLKNKSRVALSRVKKTVKV